MGDIEIRATERLEAMDAGELIDVSLTNGILCSSKEAYQLSDGTYRIFHGIDGTMTDHTRQEMFEILTGDRSPWGEPIPDNSCDQCEALMIQGVFTHEHGCPNTHKVKTDGQWVTPDPEGEPQ